MKWAFSTGATALAAPTVGGAGVIATSNDKVVYAMERGVDDDQSGVDSGEWPASFEPVDVGGPVQGRSPVVPVTVSGANPVVYVGSQDGSIYTIDATAGGSVPYLWVTPIGPMVQAAPAGIFSAFNGATLDYILVGTRDSAGPNAFVALDPYTGVEIDRFDNGGAGPGEIGIVNGMAAVDYGPPAPPRVYFTNYERTPVGSTLTLRCFELADTPPVFNQIWARALGNIDSSPVLRERPRLRRQPARRRDGLLDRRPGRKQHGARPDLRPRQRAGEGLRLPRPRLERRLLRDGRLRLGRDGHRRCA